LAVEETALGATLTAFADTPVTSSRWRRLFDLPSVPIVQNVMCVRSESSGPYAVAFRAFEHAKFVAVLRGGFDLQVEGEARAARLRQGDCYMLTSGRPYRIFNADVPVTDAATLYTSNRRPDGVVRWGNGNADTVTLGSRAMFNRAGAASLRAALPPCIRLPAGTLEAERFCAVLTLLGGEYQEAPGATFAADRYIGILLVQALRHRRTFT
jgi:hypothetical protein